ncbi:MAG: rhomboid family intramembrane serine protease [Candidatus Woesearchaeota archaeon]
MQLTLIFIGINIIVFILQQFGIFSGMSFMPATFIQEPWTILTSMFMHGSLQHLLLNMLGLFMFGSVVENEFGKLKWIILYFFAGFSGSVAYMLFSASPFISALGASGAIFGLMAGAAVLKPGMIIWTAYGPFPMFIAAIGWGFAEFAGMFGISTIARTAHIGGLVCGALMAFVMLSRANAKVWIPFIGLPLVAAFVIGVNLPSEIPQYFVVPEGFLLNYSEHETGFKTDIYSKENDFIIVVTQPAVHGFNLAIYSNYLAATVMHFYSFVFSSTCPEEVSYKIEEQNETAVIKGQLCSQNFKAVAAVCQKNVDVRVVEFYKTKSSMPDFVSCEGLFR